MKKIKTVLWAQNESSNKKDSFVINGDISAYASTPEQDEAYAQLTEAQKWEITYPKNKGLFKTNKDPKINYSFIFKKTNKGIYIESCFKEKDEVDRSMAYMFYTNSTNIEYAINILTDYSKKINRTCVDNEFDLMRKYSKKNTFGCLSVFIMLFGLGSILYLSTK